MLVTMIWWTDPETGPGQRTRLVFRALKRVGEVHVACLGTTDRAAATRAFPGAAAVHALPQAIFGGPHGGTGAWLRDVATRILLPSRRYRPDPEMRSSLLRLADHAHTTLYVFRFARTFCLAGVVADPVQARLCVVDVDDRDDQRVQSQLRRRFGAALADGPAGRLCVAGLRRTLARCLDRASQVWVVKPQDRLPGLRVPCVVVPNAPLAGAAADSIGPPSDGDAVIFVGNPAYGPNTDGVLWFLRECWPRIRRARPRARLRLVGGADWGRHVDAPGVEVAGRVAALAPEYGAARVAICPILSGAGSQVKLIEAAAFGRPVVATSGVADGFGPALRSALAVADRPAAFADAVIRYLQDPAAADTAGRALRETQRSSFTADAVEDRIVRELAALVASQGAEAPHSSPGRMTT